MARKDGNKQSSWKLEQKLKSQILMRANAMSLVFNLSIPTPSDILPLPPTGK